MLKNALTNISAREAIARIARKHGLRLVVLYGSVARGSETAMSDIDIGVLGTTLIPHEGEAVIAEELSKATGMPRIEVKSLHHASPLFLDQVMRGIVLFADTPTRAQEVALYAWKLAAESQPLRDARFKRVRERAVAYAQ